MPPIQTAGAAVPTRAPAGATDGDSTALRALQDAIETHAKLCLMAKQLPERIAAAQEAVDAAYERLGVLPPGRRRGRMSGRRSPGELTELLIDALPGTAIQIAEATGVPDGSVRTTLSKLVSRGLIVVDDTTRPRTYRRAVGA